ncbi:putative non-specific serine/threonine protein kinase [Helianthus anomalus]
MVWQSFDRPTDCLVPGQRLFQGQQLTPSISSTNWTAQKGFFSLQVSLQVTDKGLFASVGSNPPQAYYSKLVSGKDTNKGRRYPGDPDEVITIPPASLVQYMKLMPDGHLKVFKWQERWLVVADLLNSFLGECSYPMACGKISVCSVWLSSIKIYDKLFHSSE